MMHSCGTRGKGICRVSVDNVVDGGISVFFKRVYEKKLALVYFLLIRNNLSVDGVIFSLINDK